MKMTRKEKITKILDKYWIRRGWIESDESMVEARPLTAKEELADAILSLPLDVPSDKEIKAWALSCQHESQSYRLGKYDGATRMRNEILKRNKIE
jgi:hypothetical protein